jgi:hypothetical protein
MFYIMESNLYTIYVFQLRNGMRYLYPKSRNIDNKSSMDLFLEFRHSILSFDEAYEPVQILRTYTNILPYNINGLVLHYMHVYGVENVRGGKYTNLIFSKDEKEEISNQIKYFSHGIEEQEKYIDKYYNFTREYIHLSLGNLWNERTRIDKLLLNHNKTQKLYENLNVVENDDIYKIVWLEELCNTLDCTVPDLDYALCMSRIRMIFIAFNVYYEGATEKMASLKNNFTNTLEPVMLLYNPVAFFDKIIYSSSERKEKFMYLPFVIALIEMIFYSMRNRCDELQFDMKSINYDELLQRNRTLTNLLKPLDTDEDLPLLIQ